MGDESQEKIRMALEAAGFTSNESAAGFIGIGRNAVSSYGSGKVPHLPPSKMKLLMAAFDCSTIDELIELFEGETALELVNAKLRVLEIQKKQDA